MDEIEKEPLKENFVASSSSYVEADAICADCTQLNDFSFSDFESQTEIGFGNSIRNLSHSKVTDTFDDDDIMTQCSEDWLIR